MTNSMPFSLSALKSRFPGWIILMAILALGGWMRMTAVAQTHVLQPYGPDARQYFNYAYNVIYHGVFSQDSATQPGTTPIPDAFRTPGYPLFLIPFILISPNSKFLDLVLDAQVWMSLLTVLLTFFLAQSFLPTALALLATFLTAICPPLITMNHYLLTESLFAFLLMASLASMARKSRWPTWFGIGVLFCMAGMVRPIMFSFLLPTAILIGMRRGLPNRRNATLAFVVGFLLLMTPWMVRNKISLGAWSDDTFINHAITYGMYPDFTYNDDPKTFAYPYQFDPRVEEIAASRDSVIRELKEKFTKETARYLRWYFISKPRWFWSWNIIQGQGDVFVYLVTESPYFERPLFQTSHRFMYATHWLLVVLAALGSLLAWLPIRFQPMTEDKPIFMTRLLSLFLGFMTVSHIAVPPWPRYNIPLRPVLYCMAMFFLWGLYRYLVQKLTRQTAVNGQEIRPDTIFSDPETAKTAV